MSREKQIEEEIDELTTELYEANHKKSVLDYRWLAKEAYNAGYRKQSEWISVDERLPETNKKVLVCYSNGSMDIAKYIRADGLEFWFEETNFTKTITHWMPLPKPPKMKGGAE